MAALVEHKIHLRLITELSAEDLRPYHTEAMLLLHEILTRGAPLPCDDSDCLLSHHPRVLALVPSIARSAARAQAQGNTPLQLYCVWFALALMDQFTQEEVCRALPLASDGHTAGFFEALGQVRGRSLLLLAFR